MRIHKTSIAGRIAITGVTIAFLAGGATAAGAAPIDSGSKTQAAPQSYLWAGIPRDGRTIKAAASWETRDNPAMAKACMYLNYAGGATVPGGPITSPKCEKTPPNSSGHINVEAKCGAYGGYWVYAYALNKDGKRIATREGQVATMYCA